MDSISAGEQPLSSAPKSFGVGSTLRAAREQRGMSVADVAKQLRIRQPFLQALEEGRHRELPGGTYAIGFLRTYAEFLGLDGEEMIRRFRDEADDLQDRTRLAFPSPESEGRIPGGAVLFLGLVVAAIAYGGWYWLSSRDSKVAEMVPPLPDRLNTVLNRPASLTGDPTAKPEATPPAEENSGATPHPTASMPASDGTVTLPVKSSDPVATDAESEKKDGPTSAAPMTAEPAKVAEPAKAPDPVKPVDVAKPIEPAKPVEAVKVTEPTKPADSSTDSKPLLVNNDPSQSRINLKATQDDCWVQIRELDGQLLISRLLHRGEVYAVPNRPGLTLMVGNAGALEITVDGNKAPSLGAGGQVRRDIKLDPDKILTGN